MTGPDLLVFPSSLALLRAGPLSPPCQPRQSPRLRLPTTAGTCLCLAPVPRLPKFILPNRTGLSCTRRVGEGATLPWDSRASPQAASSPQAPQPPSATDPVTSFVAPTSRSTDQSAAPRDGRLGAETTPHSPAGRGLGLGRGRGAVLPRNGRDRYSAESRPGRGRRSGEGGNWKLVRVWEKKATRRRRGPPPTSVDAGRWSPVSREKLTK